MKLIHLRFRHSTSSSNLLFSFVVVLFEWARTFAFYFIFLSLVFSIQYFSLRIRSLFFVLNALAVFDTLKSIRNVNWIFMFFSSVSRFFLLIHCFYFSFLPRIILILFKVLLYSFSRFIVKNAIENGGGVSMWLPKIEAERISS